MDYLMWWFDVRFYHLFLVVAFIELLYALLIYLNVKKALGRGKVKRLPFVNKFYNYLKIVFLMIIGFLVIVGLINILKGLSGFYILAGPLLAYFAFLVLERYSNYFNYNDDGFVVPSVMNGFIGIEGLKWRDVECVKWDSDIGQRSYGFYVYSKTFKPIRLWIERKYIDELKELFGKYNIQIEINN
jgi:hypothetical protein